MSLEELNNFFMKCLYQASINSIPIRKRWVNRKTYPRYLVDIINQRKLIRKEILKKKKVELKPEFNRLTAIINAETFYYDNLKFLNIINRCKSKNSSSSSKPLWMEVNKFRSPKSVRNYPTLFWEGKAFSTDLEKSGLFAGILASTFEDNYEIQDSKLNKNDTNLVNKFNEEVSLTVKNWSQGMDNVSDLVTLSELNVVLNSLKKKSSSGKDGINNLHLINIPDNFKQILLKVINKSLSQGQVLSSWKVAVVSMIPKKIAFSSDPTNYRPISLLSCVGKVLEKIIKIKLVKFLDDKKIIIDEQSGFRKNRRTSDNLFFLTQKVIENFNRGKKCLAIFFDIAKAFDKVYHEGLIYKLIKIGTPDYLIKWIISYLKNRKFSVRVGDSTSDEKNIETGVPQGGVLSPILFNIFINDIPKENLTNIRYSLLFADDLTSFFCYDKPRKLLSYVKKYLKKIEFWLVKWKLKMSANKCCYITFSKKNNKQDRKFNLNLFGENIPYDKNPTFLGIKFDENLTFVPHLELMKKKLNGRQNLLKILSHRKWKLSKKTLLIIYYALIRSLIDYIFFISDSISVASNTILQRVQNRAIKSIYHLPLYTNLDRFQNSISLSNINDRMNYLNKKYLLNSISNNNPLIMQLISEYKRGFQSRVIVFKTPLCSLRQTIFTD
jgi:hypothetical protein